MKIIQTGKIPESSIYKFTCNFCNCIFECYENECQEFQQSDGIYFSWGFNHKCPTCGKMCYSKHY